MNSFKKIVIIITFIEFIINFNEIFPCKPKLTFIEFTRKFNTFCDYCIKSAENRKLFTLFSISWNYCITTYVMTNKHFYVFTITSPVNHNNISQVQLFFILTSVHKTKQKNMSIWLRRDLLGTRSEASTLRHLRYIT